MIPSCDNPLTVLSPTLPIMIDDPTAVVDDNLNVYGLKNIRVIDASIMPTMLSANLHSGATLIGEKGSDLVLGNNPIDPVILNY